LVDANGAELPGQASFGHIAGGYDAGYYGWSHLFYQTELSFDISPVRYLYSLVFAADMYATVFKEAPLDPARGRLYREKILKVGGSRKELESLKVCSLEKILFS
jgi:metallopeptidase MepB